MNLPRSQGEVLRLARGSLSQAAFARQLGVDRTCLCRYESEVLGAPTAVLNECLGLLASRTPSAVGSSVEHGALVRLLELARQLVQELEAALNGEGEPPARRSERA
jgi:hypothetical protein